MFFREFFSNPNKYRILLVNLKIDIHYKLILGRWRWSGSYNRTQKGLDLFTSRYACIVNLHCSKFDCWHFYAMTSHSYCTNLSHFICTHFNNADDLAHIYDYWVFGHGLCNFFSFGYFTFIKKILPIKNKFTNLLFTHLAIV